MSRLETSRQKFTGLYRGQRSYPTCLSTSLSSAIGPLGEVWLCVNHRQLTQIGDLKTETLAEVFAKKDIAVNDLTHCRLNCRNDQLNQSLSRHFP